MFINVSKIFDPIMFADDKNLFFSHKNINELVHIVSLELSNVFKWFNAKKISLNKDEIKYKIFHEAYNKKHIPLKPPSLFISDREINQITSIKFLGVLVDENFIWKEHITLIENKKI